ncbi:MAG TPA: hypothetical protein VFI91_07570 [Longimicrobiaceae bacterium]|nr:hypothetical protein [Longimicrobiaceae bacterium]
MKSSLRIAVPTAALFVGEVLHPFAASAQGHMATESAALQGWFSLVEVPALFAAVIFGFLTAKALRGGKLGTGMTLIAWGFLVMAIGHLHMQAELHFGFNLFGVLFGDSAGAFVWFVALVVTWTLTGAGFFKLYRAGSGA